MLSISKAVPLTVILLMVVLELPVLVMVTTFAAGCALPCVMVPKVIGSTLRVYVAGTMSMLSCFVSLPAAFSALTIKLNVPVAVGVPLIKPVDAFKDRPIGREPLDIDHVVVDSVA